MLSLTQGGGIVCFQEPEWKSPRVLNPGAGQRTLMTKFPTHSLRKHLA